MVDHKDMQVALGQGAAAPCGAMAWRPYAPTPTAGLRPATPPSRHAVALLTALALSIPSAALAQPKDPATQEAANTQSAMIATPPDDMFIDIQVPAHQIYVGETMRVEYDVLVAARRGNIDYHGEDPDFVNWYKIIAPPPPQSQASVNGKPYIVMPFDAYFVSPTKAGKIPLPTIRVQVPYISTKPWITHTPRVIEVIPLPTPAPEGFFYRNVGQFTIHASTQNDSVHIGDVVIVDIEVQSNTPVSGVSIAPYKLAEAADAFRPYPIQKVFLDEKIVKNKLVSTIRYKARFLAMASGNWKLDPFRIVFFDPQKHQYQTIFTDPIDITVDGEGTVPHESVQSIRNALLDSYKIKKIRITPMPNRFSIPFWWFLLSPVLLIIIIAATKLRTRILKTKNQKKRHRTLMEKIAALHEADTAREQTEVLSSILAEQFATPVLRNESEMKAHLLHTFSEADAEIITEFLRDLRMTSYSTKLPIDRDRTESLIEVLKRTKPVEEDENA